LLDLKQRLQRVTSITLPGQRQTSAQVQAMTKAVKRSTQAEIIGLRSTQKTLHEALRSLFELLELYSPLWYEKRFHNQAKAALKRSRIASVTPQVTPTGDFTF
jgi:hypothetical protein